MVETQFYRPGPLLALPLILVPAALALGSIIVILQTGQHVPTWLPLLLLLWIPCLPVLWLLMKSVRWSATGLAVGRPWQPWLEITWDDIERVERRAATIRVTATNGASLSFAPGLLRDGLRLTRQLMLRLPSHVLQGEFRVDAQQLITGEAYPSEDAGITGMLRARPRTIYSVLAVAAGMLLAAGAVLAVLRLPLALGIVGAVIGVCGTAASFALAIWLRQLIVATERGIAVSSLLHRHVREMAWTDVGMIECARGEVVIRLRGVTKLRLAGPGLLGRAQRDILRAFLHEYCIGRAPVIYRKGWWL